jgi:hypothetical protein
MVIFGRLLQWVISVKRRLFSSVQYIFADGKTLATFANSVIVLQDKSSTETVGYAGTWFSL